MKTIDLHTHTTASDGSFSPVELVNYAVKRNLSAIAITDHDTMNGIQEAKKHIGEIHPGLELIPGIEVSSYASGYPYGLHILGYFIDKTDPELTDIIKSMPKELQHGRVSPRDAIIIISKYGGISVLAHPKDCFISMQEMDTLIGELKSYGLKGLECIYTTHSNTEIKQFKDIAIRHNLLITGGTDFHGLGKPDTELGSGYGDLVIPYDIISAFTQLTKPVS